MKVNFNKLEKEVKKFQEGGAMPAEGAAPAESAPVESAPAGPEAGGDPMQQILQAAAQAVQNNDGQLALQVLCCTCSVSSGRSRCSWWCS